MIILQIIAVLFALGVWIGFIRVLSELYSIRQWISHVNDKLTRIEYSTPEKTTHTHTKECILKAFNDAATERTA